MVARTISTALTARPEGVSSSCAFREPLVDRRQVEWGRVAAAVGEPVLFRRVALTAILGLVVLLVASQAAYAVARNVPFHTTLFSRTPGFCASPPGRRH